jgi:hypothetical protein
MREHDRTGERRDFGPITPDRRGPAAFSHFHSEIEAEDPAAIIDVDGERAGERARGAVVFVNVPSLSVNPPPPALSMYRPTTWPWLLMPPGKVTVAFGTSIRPLSSMSVAMVDVPSREHQSW